ncbi:MAG: flavin-containing monooxygenase [Acidimicrobiales bacterium]
MVNVTEREPAYEVVVIGAGFGGIGAAIALQRAGVDDVLVVDKWHRVGGTWSANTYPGVAVDIPSFIYSYSYEQRADWSRLFAPGAELLQYAEDVVDKYGLRPKLRLSTTIVSATFGEDDHLWRIVTESGESISARFLIGAVGGLERPKLPNIDGIDSFTGKVVHTARWDHEYALAGKRVAVIGTGATALQLVPEIADTVEHLSVFQRTPIWVAPKIDFEVGPVARFVLGRRLVRSTLRAAGNVAVEAGMAGALFLRDQLPYLIRGAEAGLRAWIRSQVPDPELREKLTPNYALGCKRPSMSNTYLKAFTRGDVDLVTDPIERITPSGIVTADGTEREIDVLVCASGFKVMEQDSTPPYPTYGRDGLNLGTFWHDHRYQAYQGVSVPRFPNFFMIAGPYGFTPGSYFWMIEATAAHAARAITETRRRGATSCEVRQEPHDRYFRQCVERASRTPLFSESCADSNTYYINYQGDAAVLRPSLHAEMWWQNRHFPLDNYSYSTVRAPRSGRAAAADPREVNDVVVAAR